MLYQWSSMLLYERSPLSSAISVIDYKSQLQLHTITNLTITDPQYIQMTSFNPLPLKQPPSNIQHSREHSESFYSLQDSRSDFTFVEQPPQPIQPQTKAASNKLVNLLGLKQSSALQEIQSSSNVLNQSMHTIMIDQQVEVNLMNAVLTHAINLHDISGIDHKEINELECSVCLQKQIDCLDLPEQLTPPQMEEMNAKMERLKQDQSLLKKQIEVFKGLIEVTRSNNQQLVKEVMQTNNFIKKKCEHQSNFPFNLALSQPQKDQIKRNTLKESNSLPKVGFKHYDIKPAKSRSASEEQMNYLYKMAAFQGKILLVNDPQNEYRIEVNYDKTYVTVEVINYGRGMTNFVYAVKFNEQNQQNGQRISEKLMFPIQKYMPKKFTLSLNILLLIFLQNQPKDEQNLQKIEEIRTISVPLPLNYFIEPRFSNMLLKEREHLTAKIRPKMFTYEIDINYNSDLQSFNKMKELNWLKNQWVSLKGSGKVMHLELAQPEEKENQQKRVVFRVAIKEKDGQEAVDLIQFLCFMLSL